MQLVLDLQVDPPLSAVTPVFTASVPAVTLHFYIVIDSLHDRWHRK